MPLSEQAQSVWAKTGGPTEWLPLTQHLADTTWIAGYLYDHWLSPAVKERWLRTWRGDESDLRALALFLCGTHDVGKAAPAFVCQSEPLAERARAAGLPCNTADELREDRRVLPHSLIGQHALQLWLEQKGVGQGQATTLASVAGAHHGVPASRDRWNTPRRRRTAMGREAWQVVREELIEWISDLTGFTRLLDRDEPLDVPLPMLVEISGLVIVADWLASNTTLFPLRSRAASGEVERDMDARAVEAWINQAMPEPWAPPQVDSTNTGEWFASRFELPEGASPHEVQRKAIELASTTDVGLMCIETTTGGGKTEAALAVAEILAAKRGLQGVLIALPTQATTNAMFGRVADWIERLPSAPPEVAAWAVTLGHGKARLNPRYARMSEEVREFDRIFNTVNSGQIHEDGESPGDTTGGATLCNAVVHQWFLSAKRRLLANFSVVTIDQLLMAALQRKHLMLAHLALSGKVVVIDEAHASDEFMFVYLDSILSWLGAYETPVVVLSATLTPERRKAMMHAYARGRSTEIDELVFDPKEYPLLTVVPRDDSPIQRHVVPEAGQHRSITWAWHPTDQPTLTTSVAEAISESGCALVVRNTVGDAQRTAIALAQIGLPVTLNHAGFLATDRARNDAQLVAKFGKDAGTDRPEQAVVVATQVVEQSLDVDFDVLFTDLAPADLLLQRIGRLHRHPWRQRPAHHREARVHILADGDSPPTPTSGTSFVYGDYHLLRTAQGLLRHGPEIRLPEDVSPLVVAALGEEEESLPGWEDPLDEARTRFDKAVRNARTKAAIWCVRPWDAADSERTTMADWIATASDFEELQMGAAVRDTQPSLEVIVMPALPDGSAVIRPPWMTNEAQVVDVSALPTDEVAREISTWSVRLPLKFTSRGLDEIITAISRDHATRRWPLRQHPLLRSELLLVMPQTHEGSHTLSTTMTVNDRNYELRYSPSQGLEVSEQ